MEANDVESVENPQTDVIKVILNDLEDKRNSSKNKTDISVACSAETLAIAYKSEGKVDEARKYFVESIDILEDIKSQDTNDTVYNHRIATILNQLADLELQQKEYKVATDVCLQAIELLSEKSGDSVHENSDDLYTSYGIMYEISLALGDVEEALSYMLKIYDKEVSEVSNK